MPPRAAPLGPLVLAMKNVMLGNCGGCGAGCCACNGPLNASAATATEAYMAIGSLVFMRPPNDIGAGSIPSRVQAGPISASWQGGVENFPPACHRGSPYSSDHHSLNR